MVNFKYAISLLLACEAVRGFQISHNTHPQLQHQRQTTTHGPSHSETARIQSALAISYSVDGVDFPTDDNEKAKPSLLKKDEKEEQSEKATEEELIARRQTLKDRSDGVGAPYTIELPLYAKSGRPKAAPLGMTLAKVLRGRVFSSYELDMDTFTIQPAPTEAEAAAEDSDARQERERLPKKFVERLNNSFSGLVVTSVVKDSAAWKAGVRPGDLMSAVSATLGDSMWPKSTLEGVKSAVQSRRNVVGADTVKLELRKVAASAEATNDCQYELTLQRPLGFEIRESGDGFVEVASVSKSASNLVKHAIQEGDRIVAIDTSLGGQLWPASSTVEGVISAVTGRLPGQPVTIRFERPFENLKRAPIDESASVSSKAAVADKATGAATGATVVAPPNVEELRSRCRDVLRKYAAEDALKQQQHKRQLEGIQGIVADKVVEALASASAEIDSLTLHMIMNAYIASNEAAKAIKIFEAATGFAADGTVRSASEVITGKTPTSRIMPSEAALNLYTGTALLRAHAAVADFGSVRRVLAALQGKSGEVIGMNTKETAPWPWTGSMGSIQPDTICFNIALSAAERVGGPEAIDIAMDLFNNMSLPNTKNPPADRPVQNEVTYNTLISALSNEGRSEEAFEMFERMKRVGLRPDKFTYTSLIKVCFRDGDLQELLYDMRERGIKSDVVTYNTIIKSLCDKREWTQATKLVTEMESRGIAPDSRTYSYLMNEMLKEGKPSACLTLFESACSNARTSALTENVYLYTTAITAASKLGDHERALEYIARMNANGVKPNLKTLTAVLGACLASNRSDIAVQLFRRMEKPDGYATSQGIRALCENGDLSESADLIQKQRKGVISGKQMMYAYNHFLRASLRAREYELSRKIFGDLLQKGYIPNKEIYWTFTTAFYLQPRRRREIAVLGEIQRTEEEDLPRFQFLLFAVDALRARNLPIEGSLYAAVLTLGGQLGGLPRKLASLMTEAKSAKAGASILETDSSSAADGKDDRKLAVEGWEQLLMNYNSVPKEKLVPDMLPSVVVRVSTRDLRLVLRSELSVSYVNRGNGRNRKITTSNNQKPERIER